jgi:hypothetical protein
MTKKPEKHFLMYGRLIGENDAWVSCACGWEESASVRDIKMVGELHLNQAAFAPEKRRDEIGYVPKDDPRLNTIIGPRSLDKRREE